MKDDSESGSISDAKEAVKSGKWVTQFNSYRPLNLKDVDCLLATDQADSHVPSSIPALKSGVVAPSDTVHVEASAATPIVTNKPKTPSV